VQPVAPAGHGALVDVLAEAKLIDDAVAVKVLGAFEVVEALEFAGTRGRLDVKRRPGAARHGAEPHYRRECQPHA
jgi:hypothetical protein